jgi:signal transduction histidine kinase
MNQGGLKMMAQQLVMPEDDLSRKKEATRLISLGVLTTMGIGEIAAIIIWLFNPKFIITPITLMIVAGMLISSITYWLVQIGKIRAAGYFLISFFLLFCAIVTPLFGGFTGPFGVIYLFVILVSGIVISVNACFFVATLSTFLYLAMVGVERAGWLPQFIKPEVAGNIIPSLTVAVQIVLFYLITFLSWFASSRLTRALDGLRRYATEIQIANERLQVSEEELRASNEELRATEEELRASNEELQAANEDLKETQEQLVRSEKLAAIGKLAGGVGHELRNPLGAIKNAVYYIKGKLTHSELSKKEPRIVEFLGIIDDEIDSSNKIINDLLSFSRVGKPSVSPTKIQKVMDGALSHLTVPENVEVINRLDANLPEVEIDADLIRQVLINIATNAIQAMPEGGKLTLDARRGDKFLEMIISDTGDGISEAVIGKIFDPLFTTRAKGIGLGLAVCKSIIERHGGAIEVESKVGEGATFTVKLPLKEN